MIEQPLPEMAIIPPLPDSLAKPCPKVIPRLGKDARVELYRTLVVLEHCADEKDAGSDFYRDVRRAQIESMSTVEREIQ